MCINWNWDFDWVLENTTSLIIEFTYFKIENWIIKKWIVTLIINFNQLVGDINLIKYLSKKYIWNQLNDYRERECYKDGHFIYYFDICVG